MALKSTVYKAQLQIADMDHHVYEDFSLILACHPSETEERLMVRILAFALNAHERLEFGQGLTDADEPDLWLKDLTGEIQLWVEMGNPDEKTLLRALGRSRKVSVYGYHQAPRLWWEKVRGRFEQQDRLKVFLVSPDTVKGLTALAQRTMDLQFTVQDGDRIMRDSRGEVSIGLETLHDLDSGRKNGS